MPDTRLPLNSDNKPCWMERLRMPSPNAEPQWGQSGILCVGAPAMQGLPALLLVSDEQARNTGASATNAMVRVLGALLERHPALGTGFQLNIVQQDSEGCFDHVHPHWEQARVLGVQWSPLRWTGATARSSAAFLGLFGHQATKINNALRTIDA